jgi:hypothetical protein
VLGLVLVLPVQLNNTTETLTTPEIFGTKLEPPDLYNELEKRVLRIGLFFQDHEIQKPVKLECFR